MSKSSKSKELKNPAQERWNTFMTGLEKRFDSFEKHSQRQDKALKLLAQDQAGLKKILSGAITKTPSKGKGGKKGIAGNLDINKIVVNTINHLVDAVLKNPNIDGMGDDSKNFYKSFMNHTLDMNKVKLTREKLRNLAYSRDHELGDELD